MFTQEESSYFRGLLVLAGIDSIITESEKNYIISIGEKMGFGSEFCSESLDGILQNEYIDRSIPVFSDAVVAEKFLRDGYGLAIVDEDLNDKEVTWLNSAAAKNNISAYLPS